MPRFALWTVADQLADECRTSADGGHALTVTRSRQFLPSSGRISAVIAAFPLRLLGTPCGTADDRVPRLLIVPLAAAASRAALRGRRTRWLRHPRPGRPLTRGRRLRGNGSRAGTRVKVTKPLDLEVKCNVYAWAL
jgi:hypothetical protein